MPEVIRTGLNEPEVGGGSAIGLAQRHNRRRQTRRRDRDAFGAQTARRRARASGNGPPRANAASCWPVGLHINYANATEESLAVLITPALLPSIP